MTFIASSILRCPLDQLPLIEHGSALRCEHGHNFDIARQGYINLLGASDKRSKSPGDSKEMIQARRGFLDAGHYDGVAHKLSGLAANEIGPASVVVGAACGEGYYLEKLQQKILSTDEMAPTLIGFDISKWAVQSAARRLDATWLVASNRTIPVADHSVDLLLSIFGFPAYDSFRRVLKEEGRLLLANAGPRHLYELREVIYPTVNTGQAMELTQAEAEGFRLLDTVTVQYQTSPLDQPEIAQLLGMTPHLFRASREGKEKALTLQDFTVTVDVVFHLMGVQ